MVWGAKFWFLLNTGALMVIVKVLAQNGTAMAERLDPRTSIPEVPGLSPGPAVAPLGKALYPHCLTFRRRL